MGSPLQLANSTSSSSETEEGSSSGHVIHSLPSTQTSNPDTDVQNNSTPTLPSFHMGRPRSLIWDHFSVHPQKANVAVCRHCGGCVSRGRDLRHLATSGLRMHMKRHHPTIKLDIVETASTCSSTLTTSTDSTSTRVIQPTMEAWGMSVTRLRSGEKAPSSKEITRCLGEVMALDHQPFRMVEREGFRRLMALLAPRYKIPSRRTFSRTVIPTLYEGCKERIKTMLRESQACHIHFTSDIWSTVGGGHSFLSLTAHWWAKEGNLASGHRWALLALEVIDKDHKASTICDYLTDLMREWMGHIPQASQLGYMVTDAGKNMIRAVESAGFTNVPCFAHMLHNTVKDGFKGPEEHSSSHVTHLVERCRKIAGFFHRSTKSARLLRERQVLEGLPQHRLLQDVSTRWNSTFKMLQRMLEQQKAVHGVMLCVPAPLNSLVPNNQEWQTISHIVNILKPFNDATDSLCAEDALLSQVVPVIKRLKRHLETFGGTSGTLLSRIASILTPQAQELVRKLSASIHRRLEPLLGSKMHILAALCDPRIKDTVCPNLPRWKAELIELVREARTRREGEHSEPPSLPNNSCGNTDEGAVPDTQLTEEQQREHGAHGMNFFIETLALLSEEGTSLATQAAKIDSAECSVNRYLDEPQESFSSDPFAYWSCRSASWPDLADVARRLLSCPPTSVQSERVFSLAGDVVSPQRSLLDPLAVEKLVFLKANLPVLDFPAIDFSIPVNAP